MEHEDDLEPVETTTSDVDEPEPVDPKDAEESGFLSGSGGPATTIYGEDDEADEHGDRLARGPDES